MKKVKKNEKSEKKMKKVKKMKKKTSSPTLVSIVVARRSHVNRDQYSKL